MHPTAERFQGQLRGLGLDVEVHELADSTRTAQEAAAAVGAELGQIVKSLVFVDHDGPVLCLCGARQARGEEVRDATGYAIGGVPPVGHDSPVRTVVDDSLRRFQTVWCAAGTPHAVFPVETEALLAALPADAQVRSVT